MYFSLGRKATLGIVFLILTGDFCMTGFSVASRGLQEVGQQGLFYCCTAAAPGSTAVSASDCCSVIALPQLRLRLGRDPKLPLPLQPDVLFDEIFIILYQ